MNLPAISVRQPWATLLAVGAKRYETRSWETTYRGTIAIHASGRLHRDDERWYWDCREAQAALDAHGYPEIGFLPLGAILAIGRLIDVGPADFMDTLLSSWEAAFGDFTPGRWAWEIANVRPLHEPIPYKGALGLWQCTIPDDVIEVQP